MEDTDSDQIDQLNKEEDVFDEKVETQRFFEIVCQGKVSIQFSNIKSKFEETLPELEKAEMKGVRDIECIPEGAHYD